MPPIEDRLKELNINIPPAPKPVAAYIPAVRSGSLVFVAGQVPFRDGELMAKGSVPSQISVDEAKEAAAQCALNALAAAGAVLDGDLNRITKILRLVVYVASDQGFYEQPEIANGASELIGQIFGDAGLHARSAIGSVALPLNATVLVEMTLEAS